MKTFRVEVRQIIEVTLDETRFTPEFMQEFRADFYDFTDLQDHAKHIAQLQARELLPAEGSMLEGYGELSDFSISAGRVFLDTEVVGANLA